VTNYFCAFFFNFCVCMQRTAQGKEFELILTVKIKNRHPVGEFSAFVIIAEFWRPMAKFSKLCSKVFIASPIDVVAFKCRKNASDGKSVKSCVIYRTKKQQRNFGSISNCRYCTARVQNLPGPALNIWLAMFQISSKSVHFRRSYSRTREGRSFSPLTSNVRLEYIRGE